MAGRCRFGRPSRPTRLNIALYVWLTRSLKAYRSVLKQKKNTNKAEHFYSALLGIGLQTTLKRPGITQFYLQQTPCLPLPRKCSPDAVMGTS